VLCTTFSNIHFPINIYADLLKLVYSPSIVSWATEKSMIVYR